MVARILLSKPKINGIKTPCYKSIFGLNEDAIIGETEQEYKGLKAM